MMTVEEYDAAPCREWGEHRATQRHRRDECPQEAINRQAPADPLDVPCPACQAKPGARCTTPTDTSRREVKWVHLGRQDRAEEDRL
jgi:hypothetical protein